MPTQRSTPFQYFLAAAIIGPSPLSLRVSGFLTRPTIPPARMVARILVWASSTRAICDNGSVLAFSVAAVFVASSFVVRLTVVFLATVLRAAYFFAAPSFILEGDLDFLIDGNTRVNKRAADNVQGTHRVIVLEAPEVGPDDRPR